MFFEIFIIIGLIAIITLLIELVVYIDCTAVALLVGILLGVAILNTAQALILLFESRSKANKTRKD